MTVDSVTLMTGENEMSVVRNNKHADIESMGGDTAS